MNRPDDIDLRSDDLSRRLHDWMAGEAPAREPASLAAGTLARIPEVRQRPRFLAPGGLRGRVSAPVLTPTARLVLLVLLTLAVAAATAFVGSQLLRHPTVDRFSPYDGVVEAMGQLTAPRNDSVVVALRDGRVLIAGGAQPGHFAEVFDPATGRSTPTAPPPTEVAEPRMALLRDGRVLIVGWVYRDQASSVAGQSVGLVFDPRSDAYTSTGPMTEPHFTPTLVTLSDGRVLVTGGVANQASAELRTAEIFDPATGRYAPTGSMTSARIGHAMTLLSDGHVLVVGCPAGDNSCLGTWAADVYDPASGTFTPTSGQLRSRSSPAALLLPDGRVLTFGLRQQDGLRFGRHGIDTISASFFDPRDGTFTAAPALPHTISTAALLPDGLVSVTGTWGLSDGSTSAAGTTDFWFGLYDPLTGETRTSLDPLTGQAGLAGDTNEAYSAAAVLPDGRVVLVGAVDSQAAVVPANSISIFK